MLNVIMAWANKGETEFESNVPLLWCAKRNRKLGSKNEIHILFLEGYEHLSAQYRAALSNGGYILHDVSCLYDQYQKKYFSLSQFGDYEKKCFLRWPIIRDYFANMSIIHYDGDIVFNETPENIAQLLLGSTFVLQGCPALTVINKVDWYQSYENALRDYSKNVYSYSKNAPILNDNSEMSIKNKWAGARHRKVISSDQDLISHLICIDAIPQDMPDTIQRKVGGLLLFENPLYIGVFLKSLLPLKYSRVGMVDYINDKKVAFWHMQNNFVEYLHKAYVLAIKGRWPFSLSNPLKNRAFDSYLYYCLRKSGLFIKPERSSIYQKYFEKYDFSIIYNNNAFWEKIF
jgi:hypothetical protein